MKNNDYRKVSFDGAYDDNAYLYTSSEIYNGMLKLNKETCEAEYICGFGKLDYDILGQHHKVYKYRENLIFTPDNATGIHIYNMSENKMSYLAIDEWGQDKVRCISSFIVGNKLWLMYAYVEHPVVIIDLDLWTIEEMDVLQKILPQEIMERKKPLFWSVFTNKGSKLYGVVWHSPYIIEIDSETKEVSLIRLQKDESKLTTVVCCEDLLWCVECNNASVTCWNRQGEFVEQYTLADGVQMQAEGDFSNLILCDNNVYMVTNKDNYIYYLDKQTKRIKVLVEFPEGFTTYGDVRKGWRRFFSYDIIGDMIRLYPTNANMMMDIDVSKGLVRGYQFTLANEYDEKWYCQTILYPQIELENSEKVWNETKQLSLEDFIGFLEWKRGKGFPI